MKKNLIFSLIFLVATPAFSQEASASQATVIFIRDMFKSNLKNYKLLVDREFLCSIEEKRYSTHFLPPGKHAFSAQIGGKESKKNAEQLEIEMEAGKTYYVELAWEHNLLYPNIYCIEITENSAKKILGKLKRSKNCRNKTI